MATDPELRAHQEWLGFLQPVGVVASAPALLVAQAHPDRNIVQQQQTLLALSEEVSLPDAREPVRVVRDLPRLCVELLGWEPRDLAGGPGAGPVPKELIVVLPEYGDRLEPRYAVPDPEASGRFVLLVDELPLGTPLDTAPDESTRGWQASPQTRFERLLRETEVQIGLLSNRTQLRLVYAPRGESSGHLTFPVDAMCSVAGRPILSALHMLLGADRLFSLPEKQRLPAILRESRKYQNVVSRELADQVLDALHEVLRGFQTADSAAGGALLRDVLEDDPNEIYGGLLATLLRLVFVLYAEDRGLLPMTSNVYTGHYSVTGLYEKLREDAGRFPDTMDQRYGAWARLVTLFHLIHDGAGHGDLRLPSRHGRLFDPDAYPFLEGRPHRSKRVEGERLVPPRVSDGVVWRVLEKLLVLRGERLSYRALDVEQIGSVYEAMMGFALERAEGHAIAVRPQHVVVDLDALLALKPAERGKTLTETAACKLTGKSAEALKSAKTVDDLVAAFDRRVSRRTPQVLAPGALYLQPGEERRRSGSHYTPRQLTEPIVRTTLGPVLEALGESPRAEEILGLRVCDPAMGSGAFLVEACRYLGDAVVEAWQRHSETPVIPPDEDPALFARRLVAQRCLYGVDKNRFAVDLAKLSLWLATLAREHSFTFLDHALRHGDSLVGLSREGIASVHWAPARQLPTLRTLLDARLKQAETLREEIESLAASDDTERKACLLAEAETALADARLVGDVAVAAFFVEGKPKAREILRAQYTDRIQLWLGGKADRASVEALSATLREGQRPVPAFHWEVEFPEVFLRDRPGFDGFVGNPPFLGGTRVSTEFGMRYFEWLTHAYAPAGHLCDLVAYFFRRTFSQLREGGSLGFVATNTIAQGDTREGGLLPILSSDGQIYSATRRLRWPGQAAVVVSVVHIAKSRIKRDCTLDGNVVTRISAYLVPGSVDASPARLDATPFFSLGSKIYGQGFLFDDHDDKASPISTMLRVLEAQPASQERIRSYIGGEELNESPVQAPRRFVIYLNDLKAEADLEKWPELAAIVRDKVKPERDRLGSNPNNTPLKRRWWAYQAHRPEFYAAIRGLDRVLAISRVGERCAFSFLPTGIVYSEQLVVFALPTFSAFALLQSRLHELWARFFGSSLEDRLRYTPSDCFETFPFPEASESSSPLEAAGRDYYEFRAALMVRNDEGMTKSYNRFHDPDELSPEIAKLRVLHDAMDRVVLDAYGWHDLRPEPKFLLDYEEEDEEEDGHVSERRKPWRYRWPDEMRDEVLARLLALNRERAASEARAGVGRGSAASADARAAPKSRGKRRVPRRDGTGSLFE